MGSHAHAAAALLVAFLLPACIDQPPPSPWLVADGSSTDDESDDPRLVCQGDNPCAANVYCEVDDEDPRCACLGGDFAVCSRAPAGACLRMNADDGLACFPTARVTTGHCRAGRCLEAGS